jgi:hypothetical protein
VDEYEAPIRAATVRDEYEAPIRAATVRERLSASRAEQRSLNDHGSAWSACYARTPSIGGYLQKALTFMPDKIAGQFPTATIRFCGPLTPPSEYVNGTESLAATLGTITLN